MDFSDRALDWHAQGLELIPSTMKRKNGEKAFIPVSREEHKPYKTNKLGLDLEKCTGVIACRVRCRVFKSSERHQL